MEKEKGEKEVVLEDVSSTESEVATATEEEVSIESPYEEKVQGEKKVVVDLTTQKVADDFLFVRPNFIEVDVAVEKEVEEEVEVDGEMVKQVKVITELKKQTLPLDVWDVVNPDGDYTKVIAKIYSALECKINEKESIYFIDKSHVLMYVK
jgi:hypothetical protein